MNTAGCFFFKARHMKTWFRIRHLLRLAAILLLAAHAPWAAAQSIVHDIEPNNTPDTLQPVTGAARIMGTMAGQDQDGFLWTVDESQSMLPWTFTLQGIPGALTVVDVMQLQYAEDGRTLTGTRKFFTLGSRDGSRPVTLSGLLFEPGEYVLGFARAGGGGSRPLMSAGGFASVGPAFGGPASAPEGDKLGGEETVEDDQPMPANGYRLDISAGRELSLSRSPAEDTPREKAPEIRPNSTRTILMPMAQSWHRFKLNEAAAQQRWDLSFHTTVGQPIKVSLQDKEGNTLASTRLNAQGQGELPDLSLPQGEYFLLFEGQEGAMQSISLTSAGLKVEGEEAEPNNEWKTANRVDLFQGVSGRLQVDRDIDIYRFELTEEQVDQRLALALETDSENRYTVCLLNDSGRSIRCRDFNGDWRLGGLALEAGQYGVRVERGTTGMAYRLTLQGDGKHDAGLEAEPNESREWANTILLGKRIRGSFDATDDTDFYRVDVDGTPQMWRFQFNGDQLHELSYYDGRGRRMQTVYADSDQKRLMLDKLYLAPGTHYISIRGKGKGDYVLLSRAQGMPDPNAETEPNDSDAHMLPLTMGQTRTGGFHDVKDTDKYYFQLAAHEHIRLDFQAPGDTEVKMRANLEWEGASLKELELASRQEALLEGVYPPGSYVLTLTTNQATEEHYRVGLQRLPRYACGTDCEPNDNAAFSNPLPADGRISGQADPVRFGDTDWHALPVREQDTEWHFVTASTAELTLHLNQNARAQRLKRESAEQPYQVTVPANVQGYLVVQPKDAYEIQAMPDGRAPAVEAAAVDLSALTLELDLPVGKVAAYALLGQQLEGTIRLHNTGQRALDLELDADASDLRWQVDLQERTIALPAGANQSVPVLIRIPDDARAVPVRLSVRAAHESGSHAHAETLLDVLTDAPLVQPELHWEVPVALRGGLNLAAASLGGKVLTEGVSNNYRNSASLIDGSAGNDREFEIVKRNLPYEPSVVVELAGDGTQPIVGFALHPVSHRSIVYAPQRFSVALSNDGEQFETVLQGTLEPVRREQYFVLPESRSARFARLTIHQNHNGDWGGNIALGELRVLAEPGVALTEGEPFNLADQRHGGHVVHAAASYGRNETWIDPEAKMFSGTENIYVHENEQAYWVLGFHNNRAARIDRIVWGKARGQKQHLIEQVDVQVSLYGPLGPWTSIGQFQPRPEEDIEWRLPEPVWARYMRFELLPVLKQGRNLAVPTAVQVYEALMDGQYRSILGLWGENTQAVYESMHALQLPPGLDSKAGHVRRETPQPLEVGQAIGGQVQLGNQEHWYRVRMPEGSNQLDIHLTDPFYLKAALAVEMPDGEPVPLMPVQEEGNQRHWTVSADPGSELLIKVFEPPRNVIFVWDTSGSIGAHHEQIYNAMGEYARGLQPGRDMANLLPFDGRLQLQDWQSDPYLMLQAVNEHQGTDSSNAESTLITASEALAQRSGSRAIVLITDAETSIDKGLWPALEQGRPQIMALGLSAASSDPEKRLMLNWSRVNGGHYSFAHDVNDMAQAFERTSVLLRQPAPYQLRADAAFVEPPADGSLQVVTVQAAPDGKQGIRPGPATAIILDASGSMLQRLDGERRIEIAKRGLMQAVAEQIPPGTPVSLRVFGHKEADSCRSDLEIPLQALDVPAARKVIGRIQARNLARTPIADSLALVREDLAQAKGPRTIVLVTDGEETCEGDPEAVIRELVSEGYDLRLNIIGFALDDPILEQIFSAWAVLGGGEYFSAADKQSFDLAVGKALQVHYTVVDALGKEVGQSLVDGEPVALPPGNYHVRVGLVPELVLEARVESEQTTMLEVK